MELGASCRLLPYDGRLILELGGPCSIDMKNESSNGTVWNPHGWNKEANLFFLDQPLVFLQSKPNL